MLTAERRLSEARGAERARLALDSYAYLHLPMVAGIVFSALGVERTLALVLDQADDPHDTPERLARRSTLQPFLRRASLTAFANMGGIVAETRASVAELGRTRETDS